MSTEDVATVSRPFVDFYRSNGISPVAQDIRDFDRHLERRESLYRALGIPAGAVRGRNVVEFCPGSGFNALYTLALEPARYLLVDGNATGLACARQLLATHFPAAAGCEFVESLVENYVSDERFDLVLCEGAIPHQRNPPDFARLVAEYVAPGGLLVVTTIDSASFLSEIIRRLVAARVSSPAHSVGRRLSDLRPLFAIDLATLQFRSRPVDDWILDNIIQPFEGSRYFSVADAVTAVESGGFDFYSSSPCFRRDWRWYKEQVGDRRRFNDRAVEQYQRNILTLVDHRYEQPEHDAAFGRAILAKSERIWQLALAADRGEIGALAAAADAVSDVASLIAPHASDTAGGLAAAADFLRSDGSETRQLTPFRGLFGRGQQYVSFIRSTVPRGQRT